ncbi:MAG: hypothetical protein H6621_00560 [Halobacteriovoraceae bacterium]|nr:hypothetical protein [Halobacteriovoraceae bacterium]
MNKLNLFRAIFIALSVFLFSLNSFSLDVDSKLTVRILKSTRSKKTILINKGRDAGLVVEDHAKFYVTEGVVARAVLVETSKKRSVWSVYRVLNPDLLNANEVMNLKITPKAKLSKDPLAMITKDDSSNSTYDDQIKDKKFSVYSDLVSKSDPAPISEAKIGTYEKEKDLSEKSVETWILMAFQSYSSEVNSGSSNIYSASEFLNNITGGLEFYMGESSLSTFFYFQMMQESLLSYDGAITDSTLFEFGGGFNWYAFGSPHRSYTLTPYITLGAGIGKVTDTFAGGVRSTTAQDTTEASGNSMAAFIGGGLKYHINNGLGMRIIIDVYRRQDKFDDVSFISGEEWERIRFGPRMLIGISYRF